MASESECEFRETMRIGILGMAFLLALAPLTVLGHDDGERRQGVPELAHEKAEQKPFGRAGDAKKASRTVKVEMNDRMRFSPAAIEVRQGETVRFIVRNTGKTMHEMVLGRMQDLKEHAALMRKFPGMEHDEPHMVHVAPGKSGALAWQFNRVGVFHFGCLIPGHFEAGMIGSVQVVP